MDIMASLMLLISTIAFVCSVSKANTQNNKRSANNEVTCTSPAVRVGKNCYILKDESYSGGSTWEEAFVKCQELGGYLATFETMNEMMWMKKFLRARGKSNNYFIGGRNINRYTSGVGDWHWIKGDEMIKVAYHAWDVGEPEQKSDPLDCMFFKKSNYYNLNAAQCHRNGWRNAYICEI